MTTDDWPDDISDDTEQAVLAAEAEHWMARTYPGTGKASDPQWRNGFIEGWSMARAIQDRGDAEGKLNAIRAVLDDPSVGSWTSFHDLDRAIRRALDG